MIHPKNVYTLKQGSKTLSVSQSTTHYIIGFKTPILARNVHYVMHPEPNIILLSPYKENPNMGTLYVQKCKGSIHEPMNDGAFHLAQIPYDDFIDLPIKHNLGIIMPYEVKHETHKEIALKSFVFAPITDTNLYKPYTPL